MGKWVKIQKIKTDQEIYYKVSDPDLETGNFFMGLSRKNKCISIFLDEKFTKELLRIDANNKEKNIDIGKLNPRIFWPAILKAFQALESNNFPQDISYIA